MLSGLSSTSGVRHQAGLTHLDIKIGEGKLGDEGIGHYTIELFYTARVGAGAERPACPRCPIHQCTYLHACPSNCSRVGIGE